MKPRTHFDQRRQTALNPHFARRGCGHAGQELQDGALAGAVVSDDAERLAARNLKRDILKRPEFVRAAADRTEPPKQAARPGARVEGALHAVPLRNALEREVDDASVQ